MDLFITKATDLGKIEKFSNERLDGVVARRLLVKSGLQSTR